MRWYNASPTCYTIWKKKKKCKKNKLRDRPHTRDTLVLTDKTNGDIEHTNLVTIPVQSVVLYLQINLTCNVTFLKKI